MICLGKSAHERLSGLNSVAISLGFLIGGLHLVPDIAIDMDTKHVLQSDMT